MNRYSVSYMLIALFVTSSYVVNSMQRSHHHASAASLLNLSHLEIEEDKPLAAAASAAHTPFSGLHTVSMLSARSRRDSEDSECAICLEEIESAADDEEVLDSPSGGTVMLKRFSRDSQRHPSPRLSISAADEGLLSCSHGELFHASCLQESFNRLGHNASCPLCRQAARENQPPEPPSAPNRLRLLLSDAREFARELRHALACDRGRHSHRHRTPPPQHP